MRKFVSILNNVLWALTLAEFIKLIANNKASHITIDMSYPNGTLAWLFTISVVVTVINYLYYHLINSKK